MQMPDIELWKVFVSLGVPGLALGVFYFLFRTFNWRFPNVPKVWVGPLVLVFIVVTAGLIVYSLSLWAPRSSRSSVVINENANISGNIAGRDIGTGSDTDDSSQSSVDIGKGTDVSGNVAGHDIKTKDKNFAGKHLSESSVVIGQNASVSGYVAGRDVVIAFDPIKSRLDELIAILNDRHQKIINGLSEYYHYVEIKTYVDRFNRLHQAHIDSLREGKILLAHEKLVDIHKLLWELERDEFWARHDKETPDVVYSLRPDAFQRGPLICAYITGDMTGRSEKYPSSTGMFVRPWTKDNYSPKVSIELYKMILATGKQ
jgi:hypothetical protein